MKISTKQKLFIQKMADPNANHNAAFLADELSLKEVTVKQWKSDPRLMEQVRKEIRNRTDDHLSQVWNALVDKAKEGDVKAMSLLFKMRGDLDANEGVQAMPPKVKLVVKNREKPPVVFPSPAGVVF